MKNTSRSFFFLLLFSLLSAPLWSLEIDEKLTTRFLKISSSNRTVLINRGLEDGLVIGDHAKFFLTTGVIARGVVVKASPTRSIWSIYRIVNKDKLYKDLAVNIKITTPVEITEDPTKSLYVTSVQSQVQVLRGDDANQKDKMNMAGDGLSQEERKDLETVDDFGEVITSSGGPTIDRTRNWEAFAMLNFNSATGTISEGSDQSFDSSGTNVDFSLGVEKYFSGSRGFLSQLSIFGLIHSGSSTMTSIEGQQIETSVLEFGGGLHYHFLASAFAVGRVIPFVGASFGVGSVGNKVSFVGNSFSGLETESADGSNTFFSFGGGIKYFTRSGFGIRALVDLYRRSEKYTFDVAEGSLEPSEVSRTTSGPRVLLGLAYRF